MTKINIFGEKREINNITITIMKKKSTTNLELN